VLFCSPQFLTGEQKIRQQSQQEVSFTYSFNQIPKEAHTTSTKQKKICGKSSPDRRNAVSR
jgi:hypothetical protein